MTADTITPGKVADLESAFEAALETVRGVRRQIANYEITTEDAAAILNETVASVVDWNQ